MSKKKQKARARRRVAPWQGTLRITMVIGLLLGVNLYIFVFKRGTSLRELMRATENAKGGTAAITTGGGTPVPAPAAPKIKPAAEEEDARVVEGVMKETDTVERVWKAEGLAPREVNELANALGKQLDLRTIRAGHSYTLRFDAEEHLRAVDYRVSPALAFHLQRPPEGGWIAVRDEKPIQTRVTEIGGVVGSSLVDAVRRAGESTALVSWFVDMFAWDINFYIDSQAGDRYKIIVEKRYLGGKFYKYGRVLAAEYAGKVGTYRAFWFQPSDGSLTGGAYYTEHGENVVKSLLKTPLKYVRVSSSFDRHRFHPILHTEKAHLGVDYAAPIGTPVWATANGRVAFVGPRGGAGNAIVVAHAGGMDSTYMHLLRFARGLHVGQEVRQKQVIGYVGMTGLATGPHLHFSLRMNGQFVDPLKLKPARAEPLPERYRTEFADVIAPRLTALSAIETRSPDRMVTSGPSAMP